MALRWLGRPWLASLVVASVYVLGLLHLSGGDPLVLVQIGTRFSVQDPDGSMGYDGQFYYYIGRAPRQGWRYMDIPAYRYQRIFYPVLAHVLSLGKTSLLPWAMLCINLGSLAGSVALVEKLLVERSVNRWFAVSVGLYAGQLFSVIAFLSEPLALFLALMGMLLFSQERWVWSAVFFSLSVLTKETMLIVAAGYILFLFSQRQFGRGLAMGSAIGVPFVLLQIMLLIWFGDLGIGAGGAGATPFHAIPFGALISVIHTRGWLGFAMFALVLVPMTVVPTVWSIVATGWDIVRQRYHPWTFALALFAATLPFLPGSTFLDLSAISRFATPLVAFVILYAAHRHFKGILRVSLLWVMTILFVSFL